MNAETVENFINGLGRENFKSVCQLVLEKVLSLTIINVDGPYDGGSDFLSLDDGGGTTTVAYQSTTQDRDWQNKAFSDAQKSIHTLGATRFVFLTSRRRHSVDLRKLEARLISELKIPATCFGAKELAELIIEHKLVNSFLLCIGLSPPANVRSRPDKREILLHGYIALGAGPRSLREEIYDDTLQLALHTSDENLTRQRLVAEALDLVGGPDAKKETIDRRVDALLSRGIFVLDKDSREISLSDKANDDLVAAETIYIKEMENLAAVQIEVLKSDFDLEWSGDDTTTTSVLIARAFIKRQLRSIENAGTELSISGILRHIGDPEQELRDYLLRKGLRVAFVNDALSALIERAMNAPIINKLARGAVYLAVEGVDPISKAKAIGAASWEDVEVLLDASVAIPYLGASYYSPTEGRFSKSAVESMVSLQELGARVSIPGPYLHECASHLLKARDYAGTDRFSDDLQHSTNGYVAHYYQLKAKGIHVPDNMLAFLATFARSVNLTFATKAGWIQAIEGELSRMFLNYGVNPNPTGSIPPHFRKPVEEKYMYTLRKSQREKAGILISHDVEVLSYIRFRLNSDTMSYMCLSWDRTLISVARDLEDCGWVVSPQEAADFMQPYRRLDKAKLISLAHSLAAARERPSEVAARIIDRVVRFACEKFQDWELQKQVEDFKNATLKEIDLTQSNYRTVVDEATDSFLSDKGLKADDGDEQTPAASSASADE